MKITTQLFAFPVLIFLLVLLNLVACSDSQQKVNMANTSLPSSNSTQTPASKSGSIPECDKAIEFINAEIKQAESDPGLARRAVVLEVFRDNVKSTANSASNGTAEQKAEAAKACKSQLELINKLKKESEK